MNSRLYARLALGSIRKNRRLYIPYWLTCQLCVCIFYLLASLSCNPVICGMKGGASTRVVLRFGCIVIGIFSVIFLFYTNSFLMRRRKKEFGLYSILGMDRRGAGRVLAWETLITASVTIAAGLTVSVVISKLGELLLSALTGRPPENGFYISGSLLIDTALIYAGLFILLMLNSMRQIRFSTISALLKSEHTGEKPPRGNVFAALAGIVLLAAAYIMAVSIQQPLTAFMLFFVAVILVIAATYLLMISGSVSVCRRLQTVKGYYYRTRHFISVSSMAFRMKRNGAGLASICILATMVLVTLSSTACLYFGSEDALSILYPRDICVEVRYSDAGKIDEIRSAFLEIFESAFAEHALVPSRTIDCKSAMIPGILNGSRAVIDYSTASTASPLIYDRLVDFCFIDAEDYNRSAAESINVPEGSALVYSPDCRFDTDSLDIGGTEVRIAGRLDSIDSFALAGNDPVPVIYLLCGNMTEVLSPLSGILNSDGEPMLALSWSYCFDTNLDSDAVYDFMNSIYHGYNTLPVMDEIISISTSNDTEESSDYYETYGGFFFLGILLSIVFLAAATIIIYYKQLSEGYEDTGRFEILRKTGMTDRDIRSSINSQMLTVFFVPLGFAVLHLCFAFPMIYKLLILFGVKNLRLLIAAAAASTAAFALFYVLVYRATARVYYKLVS